MLFEVWRLYKIRNQPEEGEKRSNGGGFGAAEDLRRFKVDLETLSEDMGMEEFEGMAVEDFGKAVLAGYEWKEVRGVGRNAKADSVFEYKKRTDKQGIGFAISDPPVPSDEKHGKRKKDDILGKEVKIKDGRDCAGGKLAARLSRSGENFLHIP